MIRRLYLEESDSKVQECKADKPEVTVIIPSYNGIKYIEESISSVMSQTISDRIEIIVVDNCSSDGTAELVADRFPEVRLLVLGQNFGFSRAVNEGINISRGSFIFLLNDDACCSKDALEKMLSTINEDDRIFSVASKMVQYNERTLLDGAGDMYCALGWAYARGKDKPSSRYNKKCDVFAACGGAALYRKSILDEIGYFDEFHFAYLEDVDMGYRGRIMGYRNVYEPQAIVYHVGSATTGSRHNEFKVRLSSRNNVYLVFKNMPLLQLILNLPFLIIGFSIKAVFFGLKGYGRAYLSGIKRGYLLCHEGRHVAYDRRNFSNYVRIQLMLWSGLFKRVLDFF